MANHVIRDVVSEIRGSFFSVICDRYTDISNKEQLTICIRWVEIGAETIVPAIKDMLSKLQLSLVNCWGQCYDRASYIMGHKHGVVKRIQDLQPKAYPTHCHGHSLSLSVKDTTKNRKLLSDTMETATEIVSLIKFSLKRGNLLG